MVLACLNWFNSFKRGAESPALWIINWLEFDLWSKMDHWISLFAMKRETRKKKVSLQELSNTQIDKTTKEPLEMPSAPCLLAEVSAQGYKAQP